MGLREGDRKDSAVLQLCLFRACLPHVTSLAPLESPCAKLGQAKG